MTRLNEIERVALEEVFVAVSNESISMRLLKSMQVFAKKIINS